MKKILRYGAHVFLAAYLLAPLALPGCILVVEEDRDRHRRLHGTEWRLEVVFYRTQTLADENGDTYLTFVDDSAFEGISDCGSFSGTYQLDDQDAVSINSMQHDQQRCGSSEATAVFLDQLERAETLTVDEQVLRINTEGSNYLVFSER